MDYWINAHETHCYRTKEKEFNEWYNTIHLPDVVNCDGFLAATRYQIKEPKTGRGSYLCVYEIETDDLEATLRHRKQTCDAEIAAGRGSDLWVPAWMFVFFRRLSRKTRPVNTHDPNKDRWIKLVETNVAPGKEEAFNAWYDERIDEILDIPGFVAASRFVIREPLEGRGEHLAIYEIESADIEQTLLTQCEMGADEIRKSSARGVLEPVWGNLLFREIFRHPPAQ